MIASRRRRILAFLIDHLIMCFFAAIACFLAMGSNWDQMGSEMMGKMIPIMIPVMALYLLKDSIYGMSPGRFVMGIAVRDITDSDNTPSLFRLTLRNFFIPLWPIEFLILVFNKHKRRLGDYVAKSVVVRREDLSKKNRIIVLLILFFIFGILFVGSTSMIIKNSSAYRVAITHIQNSSDIRSKVNEIKGYGHFPLGSIQVQNGYGYANLKIKIIGNDRNVSVNVMMEKKPNQDWVVQNIDLIE